MKNEETGLVISPQTIQDYFNNLVVMVNNGDLNALEVYAKVKEVEKLSEKVKKEIEEVAMQEAEAYDAKSFKFSGYSFTKTDGRRTIDYSNIEEWAELKGKMKKIEERHKEAALSSKSILDEETGEIIQRPIVTYSKSSLSVKK